MDERAETSARSPRHSHPHTAITKGDMLMKLTTLALVSAALGSAGLSACHHGGTYAASPRDTTYVSTHTVTTTTTTSGGDVTYTTDTTGSTSATTTSATTTSAMPSSAMPSSAMPSSDATRNSRSNMRAE